MKRKNLILIIFLLLTSIVKGQAPLTSENDFGKITYRTKSEIQKEEDAKKIFINNYIRDYYEKQTRLDSPCATYIIPVVFHVYGTEDPPGTVMQNGSPVTLEVIQSALDETNKDFNGLNTDFISMHDSFQSRRGILSIEFRLAQIDPNGNPTDGVVFHTDTAASYAPNNSSASIPAVQADAWDNYKYMNIYIQSDWQGAGVTNLSGIAWPPDTGMSNAKMARICYNGRYLGSNCGLSSNGANMDFTGVFTHEFGHFFDLAHLFFDNNCYDATTNDIDGVPDTPNDFLGEGCHSSQSATTPDCPFPPGAGMPHGSSSSTSLCNSENYMTYNSCYKMFTVGQDGKMVNALNHPARITLWQPANLVATGVACLPNVGIGDEQVFISNVKLYPNPSDGTFNIAVNGNGGNYKIEIKDLVGRIIYDQFIPNSSGKISSVVSLDGNLKGIFFLTVSNGNYNKTVKVIFN